MTRTKGKESYRTFIKEEGRRGDLGLSSMEVMLKRNVVLEGETKVGRVGDEENGEIGKV